MTMKCRNRQSNFTEILCTVYTTLHTHMQKVSYTDHASLDPSIILTIITIETTVNLAHVGQLHIFDFITMETESYDT